MARPRPPVWLLLAAAAYLGYFGLLICCHIFRPDATSAGVLAAQNGSVADRLAIEAYDLTLPLRSTPGDVTRDGVLFGVRFVQLVTLILGIAIAVRKPRDPVALLGAWLLATTGVFSVVLPSGWAWAWRAIPSIAGLAMWLPYWSSLGAGVIFFAFAAYFTKHPRAMSAAALGLMTAIVAVVAAPHAAHRMSLVYGWDAQIPWLSARNIRLVGANIIPAGAAMLLLWQFYRRSADVIEKRRAQIVIAGGAVGAVAGVGVLIAADAIGPQPGRSFFTSSTLTVGTILFLVFPLSFSYAILRYRLFDLSVAIRLGLRYALARRALLSVVPIAAGALAYDIWKHGDRPLGEVIAARATIYALLAGAAVTAHLTRDRWLDRLDRTFFRERYDARRILIDLVNELRGARSFDELAALATTKIEQALHPKFLVIGAREQTGGDYQSAAVYRPEKAPALPAQGSVLMDLARLLKQPMDVAPESSEWLSSRLPEAELRYLRESRIALIVPIAAATGGDALLLLGPKRSEEPYSAEDRELLSAIGDALAVSLKSGHLQAGRAQLDVDLPRTVGGRYRLERLIGRGGMGVVYEALDLTLDRRVAVKLIREELMESDPAVRRFEMEARAAAGFSHPNVITVHDFHAGEGRSAMIVMELLSGHALRTELTGSPLPAARVREVMAPVADAIDAAHARRLLHRDLKPENIFIASSSSGQVVKVLDFGIAKPLDALAGGMTTLDGVLVGTPRYMAPEQLRGEPPSTAWDLWALAVIAFEMLTGAHPFGGPRPSGAPLPAPLQAFFQRAFANDIAERPSTAQAFKRSLEDAIDAAGM